MKSVADGLLQAAKQRGKEMEVEVGVPATELDLTLYIIQIIYERGFMEDEALDVAEVIQDVWNPVKIDERA